MKIEYFESVISLLNLASNEECEKRYIELRNQCETDKESLEPDDAERNETYYCLAQIYDTGYGVKPDHTLANKYYNIASQSNDTNVKELANRYKKAMNDNTRKTILNGSKWRCQISLNELVESLKKEYNTSEKFFLRPRPETEVASAILLDKHFPSTLIDLVGLYVGLEDLPVSEIENKKKKRCCIVC